jgi:general secretion pathway protein K
MNYRFQRGVALVTALLVVSLATVAAVAMATRQHVDVRRTANLLHGEQAYAYALAAESWARVTLRKDARDNNVDSLDEDWATALPPIVVEGGLVDGEIRENHGRFNLNNLVNNTGKKSLADFDYFKRLLVILDLEPSIAGAVFDWIDEDTTPEFPDGVEDNTYLLKAVPYRTLNDLMVHISELRLIEGLDAEAVATLLPHVTALPKRTNINVNTATPEVILAFNNDLEEADVETLIADRGDSGYPDIGEFLSHTLLAGLTIDVGVDVQSEYFTVYTDVFVGRGKAKLESLIWREPDSIRVLYRARNAGLPLPATPES